MESFYVHTVLAVNSSKLSLGNLHRNIVVHFSSYTLYTYNIFVQYL